jgi:hypothetical protein
MFTSFQVTGSHDEGKEAGRQDPKRPGSETKFYQPAESAGKNPLAAGKNKKNGHIWYDLVRFGAIYCDLLVLFQKPPHSISWIYFFWRYLALFGVSADRIGSGFSRAAKGSLDALLVLGFGFHEFRQFPCGHCIPGPERGQALFTFICVKSFLCVNNGMATGCRLTKHENVSGREIKWRFYWPARPLGRPKALLSGPNEPI